MGKAKGKNRRERANRDRQQQQDLERRGVRTVTRKSKGGSTRSTEIDRFEVAETNSSKGETMVELMKRMKEQYKAKEQEKAQAAAAAKSRYSSNATRGRPPHSGSSSRNTLNNHHYHHQHHQHHHNNNNNAASRVQFAAATERVWNRGNNVASKVRSHNSSRGPSRGSSVADSLEDREEPLNEEPEESEYTGAQYDSRPRNPQQLRFENSPLDDDVEQDDEDSIQFVGTQGRRIDQAVMDALQISRGRAKKLITAGKVRVDGRKLNPADKGHTLQGGESVQVFGQVDTASTMSSTPASPALSARMTPDDASGWDELADSASASGSSAVSKQQQPWSGPSVTDDTKSRMVGKQPNGTPGTEALGPVERLCNRLITHRRHWLVLPYTGMM